MVIKTLQNVSLDMILDVFNQSFSNSIYPFEISKEQFQAKISNDSIHFEYSVGAFVDQTLVGFILHGKSIKNNKTVLYNGGTGVIPEYRGQKIIEKLYNFILPIIKQENIQKIKLEVISNNEIAQKIYKRIGFKIDRELDCYKGNIDLKCDSKFTIKYLEKYNPTLLQSFWEFNPSWQNDVTAINKSFKENISVGLYDSEELIGYIIYTPIITKVQQFAINKRYRRQGLGKQLFKYISDNYSKELKLTNIDHSNIATSSFLEALGFKITIKQYEMSLYL